jgi:hypothetical protein
LQVTLELRGDDGAHVGHVLAGEAVKVAGDYRRASG